MLTKSKLSKSQYLTSPKFKLLELHSELCLHTLHSGCLYKGTTTVLLSTDFSHFHNSHGCGAQTAAKFPYLCLLLTLRELQQHPKHKEPQSFPRSIHWRTTVQKVGILLLHFSRLLNCDINRGLHCRKYMVCLGIMKGTLVNLGTL